MLPKKKKKHPQLLASFRGGFSFAKSWVAKLGVFDPASTSNLKKLRLKLAKLTGPSIVMNGGVFLK